MLEIRQHDTSDAPSGHRQQLALINQIGSKKDRQYDLCDLPRLKTCRTDTDPYPRAIDLRTDEHWQYEQHDADECECVTVTSKVTHAFDNPDRGYECNDSHSGPGGL